MTARKIRIGFLVPPGNPTVEPEQLARRIDVPEAQAVFLSGLGMPTLQVLEVLERDLGKPALSSASAMMWNALRIAGAREPIKGYGRLLSQP